MAKQKDNKKKTKTSGKRPYTTSAKPSIKEGIKTLKEVGKVAAVGASMIPAVRGAKLAASAVRGVKTVKLEKTAANLKKAPKSNVKPSQSKFTGVSKREGIGPRERARLSTPSSEREKMALKYVKEQAKIRKAKGK